MDDKHKITITVYVDGVGISREYTAHEVSDIDWNPHINDMADSIIKSSEPL